MLEPISKIGFWFKIAAGPSFPAKRDFPSDQMPFVGRKPQVHLRRIEDLKRSTNPAEKGGRPKDIFEIGSNQLRTRFDNGRLFDRCCAVLHRLDTVVVRIRCGQQVAALLWVRRLDPRQQKQNRPSTLPTFWCF